MPFTKAPPVYEIGWQPQPGPQTYLLSCPVEDIFFGGAKGGGKTDGLIGDWLTHNAKYGRYTHGLLTRKTYPELGEVMARCQDLFPALNAVWHAADKQWEMANGGRLDLRFLETEADATKYEGHEFTWQGFDEVGDNPTPAPYDRLRSRLRSKHGIPCTSRLTGNPGGSGHTWLKKRYITPAPPMRPFWDAAREVHRVYIPSRLSDNRILNAGDPEYARRLRGSGTQQQVKAWLDGSWEDYNSGGHFDVAALERNRLDLTSDQLIRQLGLRPAQFWDLATKEKQLHKEDKNDDPDFSACATVARDDLDRFIILNVWQGQVSSERLIRQMHALQERYRCRVHAEKGGIANMVHGVLPMMNKLIGRDLHIIPVGKGAVDKVQHSIPLQMLINSGNAYLAADCDAWWPALSEQLRIFPNIGSGVHDDMIDALSYSAEGLKRTPAPTERLRHASLPRDLTGRELEDIIERSKVKPETKQERPWW